MRSQKGEQSSDRTWRLNNTRKVLRLCALLFLLCCLAANASAQKSPNRTTVDTEVSKLLTRTNAKGMAVAVIDRGKVAYVQAYGSRNANGEPLTNSCGLRAGDGVVFMDAHPGNSINGLRSKPLPLLPAT